MPTGAMSYRDIILDRLDARNEKEHALQGVIVANQALVQKLITLQRKEKQLEAAVKVAQYQNETLTTAAESAKALGSPENQQRMTDLDRRIHELNEERVEMYKTQSENAQRLVHMNEQLGKAAETEKLNSAEIKSLTAMVKQLQTKCDLQVEQLREKDNAIQVLQDEYAAIQLEITTTEERSKTLEKENEQLLQRWLDQKNKEAEKMNEAAEFYESFLEHSRKTGQTLRKNSGGKWVMGPQSSEDQSPTSNRRNTRSGLVVLPTLLYKKESAHDDEIFCIQASSTGSMFASGGSDKKIKVFDAKTGNLSMSLGGSLQSVTSICFNPTDELVLGSSSDNATRIWQLSTRRSPITLTGHIGKVAAAKFTADSKRVVSGSHDRTLKIWDLKRGYCLRTMYTFASSNDIALVDVEGHTIASGHMDSSLRLWDSRTGTGIKELTGIHNRPITSLSMSPDGDCVLTNSRDNTLKIVDLRMYNIVATFDASSYQSGANYARACFSPDAEYVAAGSADGTLHVWNALTQNLEFAERQHEKTICGVSWSPLGDYLYTAESKKNICIWKTSI